MSRRLRVLKAIFKRTGTYDDQVIRPFAANCNGDLMREFASRTEASSRVSAGALAGLSCRLLQPRSTPIMDPFGTTQFKVADIEHGWGTARWRFFIEVEINNIGEQTVTTEVLSGFMEHHETILIRGNNAHFAPDARYYFNNSVLLSKRYTGGFQHISMRDSLQVLHPDAGMNGSYRNQAPIEKAKMSLRPEDAVTELARSALQDMEGNQVVDSRPFFSQGQKYSNRMDLLPSTYISKTLNRMTATDQTFDIGTTHDPFGRFEHVASEVSNPNFGQRGRFLSILTDETPSFRMSNFATHKDITRILPNLEDIATVTREAPSIAMGNGIDNNYIPQRGDYGSTTSSRREAGIAVLLAQAVPAIMMENMLMVMKFTASNVLTTDGRMTMIVDWYDGYAKSTGSNQYIDAAKERIIRELLLDLTDNNMETMMLKMSVDIVGDTFINLSFNNSEPYEVIVPSFCDGLTSPMITYGRGDIENIAYTLGQMHGNTGAIYGAPVSFGGGQAQPDHQHYGGGNTQTQPGIIYPNNVGAGSNGTVKPVI